MNALRPYSVGFFLKIGEFIHLYKDDIEGIENINTFRGESTERYLKFLDNYKLLDEFALIADVKSNPISISRKCYLKFLIDEYTDDDFEWIKFSKDGVAHSKILISNSDDKGCMSQLGLLNIKLDEEAENWWLELAQFSRKIFDKKTQEIGNAGEALTVKYEIKRLGDDSKIEKMYIQDNNAGYDILSYIDDTFEQKLHIEVKASNQGLDGFANISSGQWKRAEEFKSAYNFYFWLLETRELAIVTYDDMKPHVSLDQGKGKTLKFRVPFRAFVDKFKSTNL